jgi:hypothetical protein
LKHQEVDDEEVTQDDQYVNIQNVFLQEFHDKYKLMQDNHKWKLKDGSFVEDRVYRFGMACSFEQ